MVAGRRACAGFCAAPGPVVASEIVFRAVWIRQVTDSHDGAGDLIEELCSGFGARKLSAVGDVACTDQDRCLVRRRCGWR